VSDAHEAKVKEILNLIKRIAFADAAMTVTGDKPAAVRHQHLGQTYDALEVLLDNGNYAMRMLFDVQLLSNGQYDDRMCFSNGLQEDPEAMATCNAIAVLYGSKAVEMILAASGRTAADLPADAHAITIREFNTKTGEEGDTAKLNLSEINEIAARFDESK